MSEEDKEQPQEAARETRAQGTGTPEVLTPEQLAEIQQKAAERDDFLDKLQRTRADYLNYQKRVKKDRDQAAEFAVQDFFAQLVPMINSLDRAIQTGEQSHDLNAFFEGIKLLQAQLHKILSDYGIERMETVGKSFDPAYHEAMRRQETTEHPQNTIMEELQPGFTMNGRTIVPARVAVAMPPPGEPTPDQSAETPDEDSNTSAGETEKGA